MLYSASSASVSAVLQRHAGDAAFYWSQRDSGGHSPILYPPDLLHFDRLLDAHLDGLRVAQQAGWEIALAELTRWQGPGEMFVCAVLALEAQERIARERMDAVWAVLRDNVEFMLRGLISALVWAGRRCSDPWLARWLSAEVPEATEPLHVAVWRAATLMSGENARFAPLLEDALNSPSAHLRAAACRMAGKLWTGKKLAALAERLGDGNVVVRAEAAIAMAYGSAAGREKIFDARPYLREAVLGLSERLPLLSGWHRDQALHRLTRWVRHLGMLTPPGQAEAVDIAILLDRLPARLTLNFVLHHGDGAYLPWVVKQMNNPDVAFYAGHVWSALTGIDLEEAGLALPLVERDDDSDAGKEPRITEELDPGLPAPDVHAIAAHGASLPAGVPCLLGAPLEAARSLDILQHASQDLRWIAARRLSLAGDVHFDTRMRALDQMQALQSLRPV